MCFTIWSNYSPMESIRTWKIRGGSRVNASREERCLHKEQWYAFELVFQLFSFHSLPLTDSSFTDSLSFKSVSLLSPNVFIVNHSILNHFGA